MSEHLQIEHEVSEFVIESESGNSDIAKASKKGLSLAEKLDEIDLVEETRKRLLGKIKYAILIASHPHSHE